LEKWNLHGIVPIEEMKEVLLYGAAERERQERQKNQAKPIPEKKGK
jgi:hypothetical protein